MILAKRVNAEMAEQNNEHKTFLFTIINPRREQPTNQPTGRPSVRPLVDARVFCSFASQDVNHC